MGWEKLFSLFLNVCLLVFFFLFQRFFGEFEYYSISFGGEFRVVRHFSVKEFEGCPLHLYIYIYLLCFVYMYSFILKQFGIWFDGIWWADLAI